MAKPLVFKKAIAAALASHGWEHIEADSRIQVATRPVMTFYGEGKARVMPISVDESGIHYLRAEFISRGENALSLCGVMIVNAKEVEAKVAEFQQNVDHYLPQAFSVRIAS